MKREEKRRDGKREEDRREEKIGEVVRIVVGETVIWIDLKNQRCDYDLMSTKQKSEEVWEGEEKNLKWGDLIWGESRTEQRGDDDT